MISQYSWDTLYYQSFIETQFTDPHRKLVRCNAVSYLGWLKQWGTFRGGESQAAAVRSLHGTNKHTVAIDELQGGFCRRKHALMISLAREV
jgi:hypothetical protein